MEKVFKRCPEATLLNLKRIHILKAASIKNLHVLRGGGLVFLGQVRFLRLICKKKRK